MKLSKKLEDKIKVEVLKILENSGRPNWDIPHTLDSVKWMKKLVKNEGGNEKILVTAMYFHDSAYPKMKKGYSYDDIHKIKVKFDHAGEGAKVARKSLKKIGDFTDQEIEEVAYLVANHNYHHNIDSYDRQLVFEADGLAQINWRECPPNFDKENCLKWMKKYLSVERPMERWKTKTGRKYFRYLLKKSESYWE